MVSPMRMISYVLLTIFHSVIGGKIISTSSGPIKGVTVSNAEPSIEAFLGIPYAEPPVGELRFRRPVSKKPWSDVYSAVKLPHSCMQVGSGGEYYEPSLDIAMSEDCLFLNLWVPYTQNKKPKTIMVFIHGGGLISGTASMKLYDGTNLARKGDVIVASMNYRLGTFGFLFAGIEEANGSMGMFDQIMALEWIKANAEALGGDPDNIVLFGESAGSLSIGYHLLSPLSKHLFRRVIMQSGSPAHMETLDNSLSIKSSHKVAALSGCAEDKTGLESNPKDVVSCLKGIDAQVITNAEKILRRTTPFPFIPISKDDFLPHDPPYLLTHGHFDDKEVLIGNNEAEGPLFLAVGAPEYFKDGEITVSSGRIAKNLLTMVLRMLGTVKNEKEVSKFYINSAADGSYLDAIGHAIGDYYVTCCVYFYAELESLKNPVYYYVMKFRPPSSPLGEWAKMTHFDEIQYVFGNPMFGNFTSEEVAFSDKIMKRWVAFAKTGNPNIPGGMEWPRFQHDDHQYLVLSEKDSVRSDRPDDGRCEIWRAGAKMVVDEEVLARFKSNKTLKTNQLHQ